MKIEPPPTDEKEWIWREIRDVEYWVQWGNEFEFMPCYGELLKQCFETKISVKERDELLDSDEDETSKIEM